MSQHEKIDYVEFPTTDMAVTKTFFTQVFDWKFTDYGDGYSAFANAGMDGGFYKSDRTSRTENGSTLIVFYSTELEKTLAKIEAAGGTILQQIFSFPGGRRFHFADPSGNEYAVWSEPAA